MRSKLLESRGKIYSMTTTEIISDDLIITFFCSMAISKGCEIAIFRSHHKLFSIYLQQKLIKLKLSQELQNIYTTVIFEIQWHTKNSWLRKKNANNNKCRSRDLHIFLSFSMYNYNRYFNCRTCIVAFRNGWEGGQKKTLHHLWAVIKYC